MFDTNTRVRRRDSDDSSSSCRAFGSSVLRRWRSCSFGTQSETFQSKSCSLTCTTWRSSSDGVEWTKTILTSSFPPSFTSSSLPSSFSPSLASVISSVSTTMKAAASASPSSLSPSFYIPDARFKCLLISLFKSIHCSFQFQLVSAFTCCYSRSPLPIRLSSGSEE